jgi:hypothetical protein
MNIPFSACFSADAKMRVISLPQVTLSSESEWIMETFTLLSIDNTSIIVKLLFVKFAQ